LGGLEFTVSNVEYIDDLSMQASGLTFEYDSRNPSLSIEEILDGKLSRIDPLSVRVNGEAIFPDNLYKPYSIALNEQLVVFLKSIGMELVSESDTNLFEYNLVRDFARKLKLLNYSSEGRIIDKAFLK